MVVIGAKPRAVALADVMRRVAFVAKPTRVSASIKQPSPRARVHEFIPTENSRLPVQVDARVSRVVRLGAPLAPTGDDQVELKGLSG
jgi:hypothetical protein